MADAKDQGNTKVDSEGAHDRVAMLSLRADGTPDQLRPEIIGDKGFALAATKRQFAEQAVSAKDAADRPDTGAEKVEQDPTIEARQKDHEKVEAAAEKRAESVVSSLYEG